jgi:hypothetical protein
VLPPFKFRRTNPTSVPSLDFFVTFLIKQKSKGPSAASRGKPAQRKKPINSYNCVIARRHDEAISFADSSMEIASADEKSAEAMTDFLKGCTNRIVVLNLV